MAEMFDTVEVEWFGHASLKLKDQDGFVVYIDPWSEVMSGSYEKADVIISTHDHFDHFDKKMIQQLRKENTVLVCTKQSEDDAPENVETRVIEPNRTVKARSIDVHGVHAYNVDKFREPDTPFHPKGFCTGVVFNLNGQTFYHASDTDPIPEMKSLKEIDVAFVPVGGHYTMDQDEAIEALKMFDPKKVVPIHYGVVDGTEADIERFVEDVKRETGSTPVVL